MPKDTTEIKKKSRVKGSIRTVVLIFILAAVAELINIFYPGEPSFFIQGKTSGDVEFNKAALGEFYSNYKNLPYSYCQSFRSKKTTGTYRIFLLGEASLSGWPYSIEQSVSRKVERNIKGYAFGLKPEIITISFAGFNSYHAVEIIPKLLKYNPDMIVLYSGHNEFYGYKGRNTEDYLSNLVTLNAFRSVFGGLQNKAQVSYDNKTDDLELILPLHAAEKFISTEKQPYKSVVQNYKLNLMSVARVCKENNVQLVISEIADNYQLPPVGIINMPGQLSADILFNNARMALLRDGNQLAAEKLFFKTLQLDGFRLRVPEEFTDCIKTLSEMNNVKVAQIKKEFYSFSQNNIPGDDLFLDYIHPNITGLEIIAAEYSRIIMNKAGAGKEYPGITQLVNKDSLKNESAGNDLALKRLRIEKSSSLLKNAKLSGKIAPASL